MDPYASRDPHTGQRIDAGAPVLDRIPEGLRATLTDDETTQLAEHLTRAYVDGYVEIPEHGWIRPGARVRHAGEVYTEAVCDGTGNVQMVLHKADSFWSRQNRGALDIELVVLRDKPRFGSSRLSFLANYHVAEVLA